MREIKFRAWDPRHQRWIETNTIQEWINRWANKQTINAIIFQQYTGLKDKNGKEIYEGDVVLVDAWKGHQKIVWHRWGAWHLSEGAYELGFFNPHVCMKVIGNIYQNPELLS